MTTTILDDKELLECAWHSASDSATYPEFEKSVRERMAKKQIPLIDSLMAELCDRSNAEFKKCLKVRR